MDARFLSAWFCDDSSRLQGCTASPPLLADVVRPGVALADHTAALSGAAPSGGVLGWMMYLFMRERREIARINLELCFPDWSAERRKTVLRENFASNGIALFEMAMAWWWPKQRLARWAGSRVLSICSRRRRRGRAWY